MEEMKKMQPAIIIRGVKKQYRLGMIGGRTLQADIQSWWAKKRGREDPNLRIGLSSEVIGKKFMALDGVDLTIYKGEAVGIIGANGAGKSTLLKLLSQITAPTEGEIDIYGRITSMLEVGTGFHGEMTGRENIYMNGAILGMTRAEIDAQMDKIIEFSEIGEFIDTPVKRYSSGMFVKLAFSVAAHLNSEIMIMDEVLAVGDMAFQKKCLDKMREAAELKGRTVLYVSHNMETIRRLCKRCVVLEKGKVIFDGDVEQAIAVYMDHSVGENEADMDLSGKAHSEVFIKSGLFMEHLTLVDKVNAVYEEDEDLEMIIRLKLEKKLENVQFRITLRTDTDAGLGTAWSGDIDLRSVSENLDGEAEAKHVDLRLKMKMDSIAKGIFYASIGFYRKDEIGREMMLDHITRAFKFEVTGSPVWYTNAYGRISLPQVEYEIL